MGGTRVSGGAGGRSWRQVVVRFAVWGIGGVAVAVAAGVIAVVALSRTAVGREAALEWALATVRPAINGAVTMDSVGPGGLLGGATLHGVRVEDDQGRTVFAADSVRARYSLLDLMGGGPAIAGLHVWSPVAIIRPGIENIVVRGAEGTTGAGGSAERASPLLRVRGARVHDGVVLLEDSAGTRRIDGVEAVIPSLEVSPGGGVHVSAELSHAALAYPARKGRIGLTAYRGKVVASRDGVVVSSDGFELTGSKGAGRAVAERAGRGWRIELDASFSTLALADLAWIDERLDRGVATGALQVVSESGRLFIAASQGVQIDLGQAGRVTVSGEFVRGDSTRFRDLRVSARSVASSEVERWLAEPLPVEGSFSGDVRVDGSGGRLALAGTLVLADAAAGDTLAMATGAGAVLGGWDVEAVDVRLAPFDYALLDALAPGVSWSGRGALHVRADGALPKGVSVRVAASHRSVSTGDSSSVLVSGALFGETDVSVVDLDATLAPLSLAAIRDAHPACRSPGPSAACPTALLLPGVVEGALSVAGPLERLGVAAEIETPGGPVSADGSANVLDLAQGYEFVAELADFRLSEVLPSLPRPTVATGSVRFSGQGLDPASLRGALAVDLRPSSAGPLRVDSAKASVWVEDGVLNVESVQLEAGGVSVEGGGSLGLGTGKQGEGLALSVSAPSIRPLRPLFMGENLAARDELTQLQRSLHEMDGADPDTFPTAREIRMEGAVEGRIQLRGGLDELSIQASALFDDLAYRLHSAGSGAVDATVSGIQLLRLFSAEPDSGADMSSVVVAGTLAADSLVLGGRSFETARVEGAYDLDDAGQADISLTTAEGDRYEATIALATGGQESRAEVSRLELDLGDDRWMLRQPASVAWGRDGLHVGGVDLAGGREGGLTVRAHGRIAAAAGESDLQVDVEGLDLGVLGELAQVRNWPAGLISARIRLHGPAGAPRWTAQLQATDARYGSLAFDGVAADMEYDGRAVAGRLEFSTAGRPALVIDGSLPANFALGSTGPRIPDGPLVLDVAADSLSAAMILDEIESLDETGGVLDGRLQVGGQLSAPTPSGAMRLAGGAAWLAPLGVRFSELDLDFGVTPDGVVSVTGSGRSGGVVRIQGAIDVSRPADPVFDLAFWPQGLQVVDRRDMEAAVSGDSITLTGSFNYPLVQGALVVDGGAVFVEELRRSSEVVDFYDHALSAAARTVAQVAGSGDGSEIKLSPFLSNLRVLVDIDIGRGSWLRSRDLNVETEGNLVVTFDRENNQLILQGDMDVVRGTYSRLPRTLNITQGLFRFVGRTSDFNPEIAITAETRLRTRDGQPLTITADIAGSLVAPQVALSSDAESTIPEADLYSYLLLGQPTSALVGPARTTSVGAGANLFLGQVFNQLGYLLALRLDVDHLSVSQAEQTQANAAFGASSLQIEVGRYLLDDVFLTGVYQRGICADPKLPVNSVGLRLEVAMPRNVTLEGFLEDRCTREGFRGLGGLSLERAQIWGFAFYRDWGY